MALIKQAAEVKPKLQKKEITIKADTWKQAEQYIKFAGLRGSAQEKMEFLVEEALLHIFATDEGFQKFLKPAAPKENKVIPNTANQKVNAEMAKELTVKPANDKKWAK